MLRRSAMPADASAPSEQPGQTRHRHRVRHKPFESTPVVLNRGGRGPAEIERAAPAVSRTCLMRSALPRFLVLYAGRFAAIGVASPFFAAFLASRGLAPEAISLARAAGTATRLI